MTTRATTTPTIKAEGVTEDGMPQLTAETPYGAVTVTVRDGHVGVSAPDDAPLAINRIRYAGRSFAEPYERAGAELSWRVSDRYWRRVPRDGGDSTMTAGAADLLYHLTIELAQLAYTDERRLMARRAQLRQEMAKRIAQGEELRKQADAIQAEAAYIEAELVRNAETRPFRVVVHYGYNDPGEESIMRATTMRDVCAASRAGVRPGWRKIDVWRLWAENVTEPTQYSQSHEVIHNYGDDDDESER